MKASQFPILVTDRLVLRKIKPEDWESISYLRTDKEVNQFVKRPSAETKEKALDFISKILHGISEESIYYWVITEKKNDKMIGSICLWNFSIDRKTGEVGYDLSPAFQKKGIMKESLQCILDFGFKQLELNCIEAYTQVNNISSIQLLEKNGFVLLTSKRDEKNPYNRIYTCKKQ